MAEAFDLRKGDLEAIIAVLRKEPAVEHAVMFGSRAKGKNRNGSDVDIALKGRDLTDDIANHISFILNEEIPLPYKFDVLNYHTIGNKDLVERIDREGVEFFSYTSDGKKKS